MNERYRKAVTKFEPLFLNEEKFGDTIRNYVFNSFIACSRVLDLDDEIAATEQTESDLGLPIPPLGRILAALLRSLLDSPEDANGTSHPSFWKKYGSILTKFPGFT